MSNPNDPQDPYGQSPEPGSQPEGQPGWGGQQEPQPPQWGQQPGQGGASMGDGYSAPPPPPNYYGSGPAGAAFPSTEKNNLGVWALVLGILGLVCCGIFAAIPAIILGGKSKQAAADGLANNGGLGTAGVVLGWIGVAWTVLALIWVFALGGLAALTDPAITGY